MKTLKITAACVLALALLFPALASAQVEGRFVGVGNAANATGEALFTRGLAAEHGWTSVMVISWRYHLPRARYIFSQCFDGEIVMRPVPRDYDFSAAHWEYIYLYQTVGFVKAFFQGRC